MKYRSYLSIIMSLVLFIVAILMYFKTRNYENVIIWMLIIPLTLSLHPVFYHKATNLKLTHSTYNTTRRIINWLRFSFFCVGIGLFLLAIISEIL